MIPAQIGLIIIGFLIGYCIGLGVAVGIVAYYSVKKKAVPRVLKALATDLSWHI